jgi:hypothetical protein
MSNPYQSPAAQAAAGQPAYTGADTGYGSVSQVRTVAVLNGVQGALEIPMGLMWIAGGIFVPVMIQMEQQRNANRPPGPPEEFLWIMTGMYLAFGTLTLVFGGLRIFAAVSNFRYRRRSLGIVSLCCGLVSLLTCYCAPTGLGILIYGLIVLLHPAVKAAFAMGEKGLTSDQILTSFVPYRPPYPPPPWPPPS